MHPYSKNCIPDGTYEVEIFRLQRYFLGILLGNFDIFVRDLQKAHTNTILMVYYSNLYDKDCIFAPYQL